MPTQSTADAVMPTAPDGGTHHLPETVDHSLDHLDLAEWCLNAGRRVLDPADGWGHLLIENTPATG